MWVIYFVLQIGSSFLGRIFCIGGGFFHFLHILTLKGKRKFLHHPYMLGWYPRTRPLPNLRPGPPSGNALVLEPYPPKHSHKGEKTTLCHNTKRLKKENWFWVLSGSGGKGSYCALKRRDQNREKGVFIFTVENHLIVFKGHV